MVHGVKSFEEVKVYCISTKIFTVIDTMERTTLSENGAILVAHDLELAII